MERDNPSVSSSPSGLALIPMAHENICECWQQTTPGEFSAGFLLFVVVWKSQSVLAGGEEIRREGLYQLAYNFGESSPHTQTHSNLKIKQNTIPCQVCLTLVQGSLKLKK